MQKIGEEYVADFIMSENKLMNFWFACFENQTAYPFYNSTSFYVKLNNGVDEPITPSQNITIDIDYGYFDSSNTTNFSNYNITQLSNISDVKFSNFHGDIIFLETLNLSHSVNITSKIIIEHQRIEIDSNSLLEFNKSAVLSFNNISLNNPQVLKDDIICSSPTCIILNYSLGVLDVKVSGFSVYLVIETPFCGDNLCNNAESCILCPIDCGTCNEGSSGGGSSGGSTPNIDIKDNSSPLDICNSDYECLDWGECDSGLQERICYDKNECLAEKNETKICFIDLVVDNNITLENVSKYMIFNSEVEQKTSNIIYIILGVFVLFIILFIVIMILMGS